MTELPPVANRKKIKTLEVMVAQVVQETPDTVTLLLFTGNDRLEYKPGHFLTIDPHQFEALARFTSYLEDVKGRKEPARAYSLTSAPHEQHIAITVKEEQYVSGSTQYPPLLSPLLVKTLQQGSRMQITGFTGPYTLGDDVEKCTDHLVHVVAGSGAVPNFSILKHALHHGLKLRHTFICSNRTQADILFRRELEELERAHPTQLKVIHTLTRESDRGVFGSNIRRGRLSVELLKELIPEPDTCLVYACGPAIGPWEKAKAKSTGTVPAPRFLESALEHLTALGVSSSRIHRESYG